jgi:hypothetical protein
MLSIDGQRESGQDVRTQNGEICRLKTFCFGVVVWLVLVAIGFVAQKLQIGTRYKNNSDGGRGGGKHCQNESGTSWFGQNARYVCV